jgi:hypothetical protein
VTCPVCGEIVNAHGEYVEIKEEGKVKYMLHWQCWIDSVKEEGE